MLGYTQYAKSLSGACRAGYLIGSGESRALFRCLDGIERGFPRYRCDGKLHGVDLRSQFAGVWNRDLMELMRPAKRAGREFDTALSLRENRSGLLGRKCYLGAVQLKHNGREFLGLSQVRFCSYMPDDREKGSKSYLKQFDKWPGFRLAKNVHGYLFSPRTTDHHSGISTSSSQSASTADPSAEAGVEGVLARNTPVLSWDTVRRALIGNTIITLLKFLVWIQTGSSAMMSEAIHTLADSGNQALLLRGLHQSSSAPDKRHQYGYGRAAFFWALVSALGMFWTGAGVTCFHGLNQIMNPDGHSVEMTASLGAVLGVSFLVDGWVLGTTLRDLNKQRPPGVSMIQYLRKLRDPFVLSVVMEDFTACSGVLVAAAGIGMTYYTDNSYYDSLASVGVGCLLGLVALRLVRMNQQYLLGQAVERETLLGIRNILESRPAVEAVYAVQSQWIGPATFSYKAEVDFDGTYLAAYLENKYAPLFLHSQDREDIEVLMSWYAEDITRLVELEVRDIERAIRHIYPQAAFIEIEPDSNFSESNALPSDFSHKSSEFILERDELRKKGEIIELLHPPKAGHKKK